MRSRLPGLSPGTPWRRCCASGRATVADVEEAAPQLLRALNENQALGREGAVVEPGEQEARDAECSQVPPLPHGRVAALGQGRVGTRPGG